MAANGRGVSSFYSDAPQSLLLRICYVNWLSMPLAACVAHMRVSFFDLLICMGLVTVLSHALTVT